MLWLILKGEQVAYAYSGLSTLDVKILEFNANTIAITIKDCSGS